MAMIGLQIIKLEDGEGNFGRIVRGCFFTSVIQSTDNQVCYRANRISNNRHNAGLKQIELLMNSQNRESGSESEFYVFRYLAAEGFLPGYNFTRLPVRTFVGYKHSDQGEYISRSRSIGLSEFGPHNLMAGAYC